MPMSANIQGLNIVQPHQSPSDSQDLLSPQAFPDISAQLDLWTNLTFDTDESSLPRADDDKLQQRGVEEEEHNTRSPITPSGQKTVDDGHGSNAPNTTSLPSFDLTAFLSGFGVDPYGSIPQHAATGPMAPSLAQLLAIHTNTQHLPTTMPSPFSHYPTTPSASTYAHNPTPQAPPPLAPAPTPTAAAATSPAAPTEEPPVKRARSRKHSVSAPEAHSPDAQVMVLAVAEDKRRRNTAASARFRLKKKEREAALEGKAKELEARVSELERECEGLRRENGWLKGLVVGVTGAAQAPVVTSPPPSLSPAQLASLANATTAMKRSREGLDG